MDESQGFAGFSPMKRMRPASTFGLTGEQQQQPQSQQQQQQQQVSPDENRQPFGSVLGNKRGRRACGGSGSGESSDMMMQCTPMKRGHVATAADEELDRLTYSKRYVQQIEQHLKYQKETYETKLRRECAAEIAAVKAKAGTTAAEASSRIALENERLRHENFVLKQGVRIQDERNKKLQMKISQLEQTNYALCLRNAANHVSSVGSGNVGGGNGHVY